MGIKKFTIFIVTLVLAGALPVSTQAQWTSIVSGADYQVFNAGTPQGTAKVYVTRMDRATTGVTIDTMIGQGKINGGLETVKNQAARYDETIGYWDQEWGKYRYNVVAAINGDYGNYNSGTGQPVDDDYHTEAPQSGQIISGWYAKRFLNFSGGSGFIYQLDGDMAIGECVNHTSSKQKVAYPGTGQDQNINGVNAFRDADELILYTPQFDSSTKTDNSGAEVLVDISRPTLILPDPAYASGTVVAIYNGQGDTPIPFDHVVLSATGSAATKLLANVSVGAEIRISQEITHYQSDCSTTPGPLDWTKTYASCGGAQRLVEGGVVNGSLPAAPDRARTAFGFDASYAYLIVVEKSGSSAGMDFAELAAFCQGTLGTTDAISQDGGGSSTMVVNDVVVNTPEFTTERAIFNGIMIVELLPKEQTTTFGDGETIAIANATPVRLGPGTNYAAAATVASPGTLVTVVSHTLNGILAKGDNWWKVDFGGTEGWAPESALQSVQSAEKEWREY